MDPVPAAYNIRNAGDKGLGILATRRIKRGELVMVDTPFHPLLCFQGLEHPEATQPLRFFDDGHWQPVHNSFLGLSPEMQARYLTLTNSAEKEDWIRLHAPGRPTRADAQVYRIAAKFWENAFVEPHVRSPKRALYLTAARLNHSCTPNVEVRVRCKTEVVDTWCVEVRAVCYIEADAELTICYVPILSGPDVRSEDLRARWDFTCRCVACDPSVSSDGQILFEPQSAERRRRLDDQLRESAEIWKNRDAPLYPGAIELLQQALDTVKIERLHGGAEGNV